MTPTTIAVLSNNRIGLFDMFSIDESIVWFRGILGDFGAWVRPSAQLFYKDIPSPFEKKALKIYTHEVLRYNTDGSLIPNFIQTVQKTSLPYTVSFYEMNDVYPVFLIESNTMLPWSSALVALLRFNLPIYDYEDVFMQPVVPSRRAIPDNEVCPITLEGLCEETATWTPCNHIFTYEALDIALQRDPRCPLCRVSLTIEECSRPSRAL
jgi:hypothetical protein